ncbi:MAG: tRNA pseudouridine(54/55) synthase Pus10 [Candidatus Thermoplasmatota archaeon]|nr:tRNA pseudouridine(54/55) synthase Pus10 [Candidatus Thermoplasmatota archaeon]
MDDITKELITAADSSDFRSYPKEEALCDSCLGRLFGRVGTGFTNAERGKAIRESLDVQREGPCSLCSGLMDEIPKFARLVESALSEFEFDTFLIGSRTDQDIVEKEETLWSDFRLERAEPIKAEINRETGKIVEASTGKDVDFERPNIMAILDTRFDFVQLQVNPLFTHGRYKKLKRGIPQTRWPCRECLGKGCERCNNTGKMYETSVEEIVAAPFIERTGGIGVSFHGMGREDVDALMLGDGRPFVLEVKEPKRRTVDFRAIEEEVNASGMVSVDGLRPSDRREMVQMKEARLDKTYSLRVTFQEPVEKENLNEVVRSFKGTEVAQRTPTRVLHRRADLLRRRKILEMDVTLLGSKTAEIVLTAEAGTYVKELVSGDGGRTTPSLSGLLGVPAAVDELDVIRIHESE